ncbi:tetratricopeptide repeat protein [Bacteroidales bacterium OttesenSCG-928-C03]|nr:tetratricopeptide repeat protein [Bacteroidales bacterium OttesenSCG-928-E04]MDL2308135.1 tetratricopeptide repeat protein [Bacteroidales bacterium OttesenSCG-928-C03]
MTKTLYPYIILFFLFCQTQVQSQHVQNPNVYVSDLLKEINRSSNTNHTKSLYLLQEALSLESKLADTTLANLYRTAGIIYKNNNSYYISLDYFYKQLILTQKIKPEESFFIENNIGNCYSLMNDKKKAREFWEKARKGFEEYIKTHDNIEPNFESSHIYNNLALLEKEEGNYAKSLEMLQKYKENNEALKDTTRMILASENIADVYMKLNENELALKELTEGLALAKMVSSNYYIIRLQTTIGSFLLENDYDQELAYTYLKTAFDLNKNYGFIDLQLITAEELMRYSEKKKDNEFYKKLLDQFPSLTKNEMRLCAFLRMNLSSKEISVLTKQSQNSIVVARSRLRKKLNLDESQNLNGYFMKF